MEIFDLGSPWSWAIGGVILMALEMAAPGFFLIWLGLAALIVGAEISSSPFPGRRMGFCSRRSPWRSSSSASA